MILSDEIIIRTESVGKKLLLAKSDSEKISLASLQSVWSSAVIKCVFEDEEQFFVEWVKPSNQVSDWLDTNEYGHVFIEGTLISAKHPISHLPEPALEFSNLKGCFDLENHSIIQFMSDLTISSQPTGELNIITKESAINTWLRDASHFQKPLNIWLSFNRTQRILLNDIFKVDGNRIRVYSPDSSHRSITALIISRLKNKHLKVLTDEVLTETRVNPSMIQVEFIRGDDVINEILSGRAVSQLVARVRQRPTRDKRTMESFSKSLKERLRDQESILSSRKNLSSVVKSKRGKRKKAELKISADDVVQTPLHILPSNNLPDVIPPCTTSIPPLSLQTTPKSRNPRSTIPSSSSSTPDLYCNENFKASSPSLTTPNTPEDEVAQTLLTLSSQPVLISNLVTSSHTSQVVSMTSSPAACNRFSTSTSIDKINLKITTDYQQAEDNISQVTVHSSLILPMNSETKKLKGVTMQQPNIPGQQPVLQGTGLYHYPTHVYAPTTCIPSHHFIPPPILANRGSYFPQDFVSAQLQYASMIQNLQHFGVTTGNQQPMFIQNQWMSAINQIRQMSPEELSRIRPPPQPDIYPYMRPASTDFLSTLNNPYRFQDPTNPNMASPRMTVPLYHHNSPPAHRDLKPRSDVTAKSSDLITSSSSPLPGNKYSSPVPIKPKMTSSGHNPTTCGPQTLANSLYQPPISHQRTTHPFLMSPKPSSPNRAKQKLNDVSQLRYTPPESWNDLVSSTPIHNSKSMEVTRPWMTSQTNPTELKLLDPATIFASRTANRTDLYSREVKKHSSQPTSRYGSPEPRSHRTTAPYTNYGTMASSKIWQPPVGHIGTKEWSESNHRSTSHPTTTSVVSMSSTSSSVAATCPTTNQMAPTCSTAAQMAPICPITTQMAPTCPTTTQVATTCPTTTQVATTCPKTTQTARTCPTDSPLVSISSITTLIDSTCPTTTAMVSQRQSTVTSSLSNRPQVSSQVATGHSRIYKLHQDQNLISTPPPSDASSQDIYKIDSLKYNPSEASHISSFTTSSRSSIPQHPKKRYTHDLKPRHQLHHDVTQPLLKHIVKGGKSEVGPLMADGGRARILSLAESKHLHRFASNDQPAVQRASSNGCQATELPTDLSVKVLKRPADTRSSDDVKKVRIDKVEKEVVNALCPSPPSTLPLNQTPEEALQIAASGIMNMRTACWNEPTGAPYAPSKGQVKEALLGRSARQPVATTIDITEAKRNNGNHVMTSSPAASPPPPRSMMTSQTPPRNFKIKSQWMDRCFTTSSTTSSSTSSSHSTISPDDDVSIAEPESSPPKKSKMRARRDLKKVLRDHRQAKRKRKNRARHSDDESTDYNEESRSDGNVINKSKSQQYLEAGYQEIEGEESCYSDETEFSGDERANSESCMFPPDRMRPMGDNGLPQSILKFKKDVMELRRNYRSFIQDLSCTDLSVYDGSNLTKCRECGDRSSSSFCRFYWFRRMKFSNDQKLKDSGFWEPEDCTAKDLALWLPKMYPEPTGTRSERRERIAKQARPKMSFKEACFILCKISPVFTLIVEEERDIKQFFDPKATVYWKRPVAGVREMCDSCDTTVFNLHFTCRVCGFAICCDCYIYQESCVAPTSPTSSESSTLLTLSNFGSTLTSSSCGSNDSDSNAIYSENGKKWLPCIKGEAHNHLQMSPTQLIPSTCLEDIYNLMQKRVLKYLKKSNPVGNDPLPLLKNIFGGDKPTSAKERIKSYDSLQNNSSSPLDWLASIALREEREQTRVTAPLPNRAIAVTTPISDKTSESVTNHQSNGEPEVNVPHRWFCNKKFLNLRDGNLKENLPMFQQHWLVATVRNIARWLPSNPLTTLVQPVMTSGAMHALNRDLWTPASMNEDFGDEDPRETLINCFDGTSVKGKLVRDFWNGFESIKDRLKDDQKNPMILKLKDWPDNEDIRDKMPERFNDITSALPLQEYSSRTGSYNIATFLPSYLTPPDLGPKMYIAYGWVTEKEWNKGTTNLHLDISDACNMMMYVGIPEDEPKFAQDALIKIIKEGGVDDEQIKRAQVDKPGALWHVYHPKDSDKIREFMNKYNKEENIESVAGSDPIHDQQHYLDRKMRERLLEEYGVKGYPIVQCEGDSVFIPAGAPHQVFNLHSCIKVAEDFVSPEHVDVCYNLTKEFRKLPSSHSNHEDKLQLKNILYHTIKEILTTFNFHEYLLKKPSQ